MKEDILFHMNELSGRIFCHVRTGLCPIGYAHPVLTYLFLAYAEDTRRHFNFHKASVRRHRRRSDVL